MPVTKPPKVKALMVSVPVELESVSVLRAEASNVPEAEALEKLDCPVTIKVEPVMAFARRPLVISSEPANELEPLFDETNRPFVRTLPPMEAVPPTSKAEETEALLKNEVGWFNSNCLVVEFHLRVAAGVTVPRLKAR